MYYNGQFFGSHTAGVVSHRCFPNYLKKYRLSQEHATSKEATYLVKDVISPQSSFNLLADFQLTNPQIVLEMVRTVHA